MLLHSSYSRVRSRLKTQNVKSNVKAKVDLIVNVVFVFYLDNLLVHVLYFLSC
jgi:hypothetical protein